MREHDDERQNVIVDGVEGADIDAEAGDEAGEEPSHAMVPSGDSLPERI